MPNLLNPTNDRLIDEQIRKTMLGLLAGIPGQYGDAGQGLADLTGGLLNAQAAALDPSGRAQAMSGNFAIPQSEAGVPRAQMPYTSDEFIGRMGGDVSDQATQVGTWLSPGLEDIVPGGKAVGGLLASAPIIGKFGKKGAKGNKKGGGLLGGDVKLSPMADKRTADEVMAKGVMSPEGTPMDVAQQNTRNAIAEWHDWTAKKLGYKNGEEYSAVLRAEDKQYEIFTTNPERMKAALDGDPVSIEGTGLRAKKLEETPYITKEERLAVPMRERIPLMDANKARIEGDIATAILLKEFRSPISGNARGGAWDARQEQLLNMSRPELKAEIDRVFDTGPTSERAARRGMSVVEDTPTSGGLLGTRVADDPARIPEYEAASHPSPTAKARHEYSGAPKNSPLLGGRTVESKADEDILIDHYLNQAEGGAEARYWYDDVAARFDRDTGNVSGARPGAADQQAAVFGHLSAGTGVPQNRLAQVRANNQFATGTDISAGTSQRNADALQTLSESAVNPTTKLKTGLFGMQTRGIPTTRGTHDFRDAINWGFDVTDSEGAAKVIGEAQHRWMDDMADRAVAEANKRKLGGFDDWTWERLQASGWVKQKADAKGVPVSALKDEVATTDEWLRANVFSEAVPSKELIDGGLLGDDARRTYTTDFQRQFSNPEGQNALAQQQGLLAPEQVRFVGEWEGATNPNVITTILADPAKGSDVMSSWSSEAVNFHGALEGLLGGQADVATSFLRPSKRAGDINAARIPFDRAVTEDDLTAYAGAIRKGLREADVPGDLIPNYHAGKELEVTWLPPDGLEGKELTQARKKFRSVVDEASGGRSIEARNSGGLLTYGDEFKPSAYLEHLQNPTMRAKVKDMLPKIAGDLQRTIKELPLTQKGKEVYQKTLELIESGGLEAIEDAVKQGILPAAVIGALLAANQVPEQPAPSQGLL